MSNESMREERHIVFKMPDLGNSLKGDEIRRLAREYAEHLEQLVKEPLDYVVIEAGWSEYAPTWKVIDVRVTGAHPAPSAPSEEAAAEMGANGGHVVEAERLAFEAWVRGHNWSLCATWSGNGYLGEREQGGAVCPHAMRTRMMWAAWRDRAALAAEAK